MSELRVCGTGGWGGPKPGDPDTDLILKATSAFGGIDVSWSFPLINPHAVAHTILYRSTSGTEADPVGHRVVSGDYFYDKVRPDIEYFYWIRVVSINGTEGELIGPVSAYARPTIEETLRDLTGQIDAGHLAQSLKRPIEEIGLNKLSIDQEMLDRAASDDSLGAAFNELLAFTETTRAVLQEEVVARAEENSAFVSTVNTLYAEVGKDIDQVSAALQTESSVRATKDAALASQITTAQSKLGDDLASVEVKLESSIETVAGKANALGALYTAKVNVNGLVGGFGVYNNGRTVEAGFDVDRFWVGRTNSNKIKPFIIEGGETFINEAVINKLTFNKLRADDGSLIVQNGKVKADFIKAKWANIEGVSIGTADIKNAAISNAKIGHAEVDTLQIRGDAVIVPAIDAPSSVLYGTSYPRDIINKNIYLDEPGMLTAIFSCRQGYNDGQQNVSFELVIDGRTQYSGSSDAYADYVTITGATFVGSGWRNVKVYWSAHGSVSLGNRTCVLMGVKR